MPYYRMPTQEHPQPLAHDDGNSVPSRSAGTPPENERRRAERVPAAIVPTQARRLTDAGWVPISASILDLSTGGLLLASEQQLESGDYVEVGFALPGGGAQLNVRLDVQWAEPARSERLGQWKAGCQFQDPAVSDRELLIRFITEQQRLAARGRST
jgi:c-di-GMP-binding flagellar brake protein YcgR